MAKNGAYHSARSDINNIRNMLLQGQNQKTSLIFILKELVQNADDCRSQRLSIGLSKGLSEAQHLLLQSPAILVVNDGHFSKKDNKSIRSIGASAKESDSSAVGKFGIGLKTVFLICEAFFYLKGPNSEDDVDSGSMLNLWATDDPDDVPKSNWDELDFELSDQSLMAQERENMGFQDGFTLWFPLRKKEHCQRGYDSNPIVSQYPGDDSQFIDEFNHNLLEELTGFLPLLKNLKTIEIFDGKTIYDIKVCPKSIQCFSDFKKISPQPSTLTGNIWISDKQQVQYFGYQQILNNTELNELKASESWPTLVPDAKGCREKQKAEQHCAVFILSRPKTEIRGKLLIRWAVFLPTGERPIGGKFEEISLDSESNEDYVLTLHGFFFLGADRRRILDWSEFKNGQVLQEWNRILAEQGTLPLLLPTLKDFAKSKSSHFVKELTQKFKSSELWERYKNFICSNGSWAYIVRFDNGYKTTQWDFIKGEVTIYLIPELSQLIEVLPGLENFSKNHILTYKNWPVLSKQKPIDLSYLDIAQLLRKSYPYAAEICKSLEQVRILYDFLPKSSSHDELNQAIKGFIKEALLSLSSNDVASNLSDLLTIIPSEPVVRIQVGEGIDKG